MFKILVSDPVDGQVRAYSAVVDDDVRGRGCYGYIC